MKWVFSVFFCLFSVPLYASVQIHICDPNTLDPFDMAEVMVGSHVSFVVSGDANSLWSGGIFIEGQDRAIGQLQARSKHPDPNSRDWPDSRLADAGPGAYIRNWRDSFIEGFDFYTDDFEVRIRPGKWFVIDYYALDEGLCDVSFYDHGYSFTKPDPNTAFVMLNTPTRDIYPDGYVNYADFAVFSEHWLKDDCSDPNSACYKADFSRNGSVGLEDVIMFADFWLHGNPGWKPARQSTPPTPPEPNCTDPNDLYDVIYAIVDVNSLTEITLQVGQSVELYVVKSSTWEVTNIFNVEVNISDPNLGSIENSSGTAQILATPRMDMFDDIQPGVNQIEGIEFFAVGVNPILDGDMASFVYTAEQPGAVTLSLLNYSSQEAKALQSILIHQAEPIAEKLQQMYEESPELQQQISEPEWNDFMDSVNEAEQ